MGTLGLDFALYGQCTSSLCGIYVGAAYTLGTCEEIYVKYKPRVHTVYGTYIFFILHGQR